MGYSVQEKAECVGTFRWIEIQLMEMLARWVPTTPEMEVKVLFGRHVWDCAQHADHLGKRAFELRAPLHYTLPAVPAYCTWIREVADLTATPERVSVFYDIVCPAMMERYHRYMENTDPLMDEPTVRILENAIRDYERMLRERDRLVAASLPLAPITDLAKWQACGQTMNDVIAHGEDGRRARGVQA